MAHHGGGEILQPSQVKESMWKTLAEGKDKGNTSFKHIVLHLCLEKKIIQ